MKKSLFLFLILGLKPLFCMESKPVKTSLWGRTKSFMLKTVETIKKHTGNPTHKYLQKSSSTYAGLVKEAGKRKAKKSLCYNAELPSFPYKEEFPLFEPGTRLTHTKHLTSFLRIKLIQRLWHDYAQDLQILLFTIDPTFSSSSWRSKLLKTISAGQLWTLKVFAKLIPAHQKKTAQEIAKIITQIIRNETKYPDYQSFFHGTTQDHAFIFELYKKLYEKFAEKSSRHFTFFRAPKTREYLREITREKYIEENQEIEDNEDPYRTDLLSITYLPWHQSLDLYLKNSSNNYLNTEKLIENALRTYGLPLPECLSDLKIDLLSLATTGFFFQILMQKKYAEKFSYEAHGFLPPFGMPILTKDGLLRTPEKTRKILQFKDKTEGRIILAPPYFDEPSQEVKCFVFGSKDTQEKYAALCDKIVKDAQQLKDEAYLLKYFLSIFK